MRNDLINVSVLLQDPNLERLSVLSAVSIVRNHGLRRNLSCIANCNGEKALRFLCSTPRTVRRANVVTTSLCFLFVASALTFCSGFGISSVTAEQNWMIRRKKWSKYVFVMFICKCRSLCIKVKENIHIATSLNLWIVGVPTKKYLDKLWRIWSDAGKPYR